MQVIELAHATDPARFGGKAADLGRAIGHGLPVPLGLALDAELVALIAESGDASMLWQGHADHLSERVAVRSSGVGEDAANASFAGQHKTLLNVDSRRQLASAIAEVWQSARSASALAYRKRLGLDAASIKMVVVVQPMVAADVAGVLFTKNPTTGADERIVEAAWGLGETVVMGLVTPDLFRMARGGRLLETRLGVKDLAVRCASAGGTEEVAAEEGAATRACLSPDQLDALDALATRCERAFDGPRDLEWAFVQGDLLLLQCRAVTR